jgi:hypothetical protein
MREEKVEEESIEQKSIGSVNHNKMSMWTIEKGEREGN